MILPESIIIYLKKSLTLVGLLLLFFSSQAQEQEDVLPEVAPAEGESKSRTSDDPFESGKFDWGRVRVGGNLGATFGYYTSVGIEPQIGYMVTKWLEPGIGGIYYYQRINEGASITKAHNYGGKVFVKAFVWNNLFLTAQAVTQTFTYKQKFSSWNPNWTSITYGNVFAGGGYDFEIGQKAWFSLSLTTNLITNDFYDKNRLYFNTGFEFAL